MIFFLLFACLAFASSRPMPLRVQLAAEPNTLDPMHVSDVLGFNLISNVSEGLVRLDGEGKLKNGLAESYRISKNGLTYRFRLRKNAKWSDGKEVAIEDFVFGLNHALDPKTAARDASLLQSIDSARREKDELVLELKKPDASLLQALTLPLAAPMRKDVWEANGGKWKPEGPSTGAYRIVLYKPDREIRLEPNPYYGGAQLPIELKVIPEENTALNLFETGRLDLLTTVPSTEVPRLEKGGRIRKSPSAAAFYLSFNVSKPPFSDVRWRKALASAVDRESLARLQPGLEPAYSYLPGAIAGAKKLALKFPAELAWAKKEKRPAVSLVYPSSELANLLLQRLQNDVKKALDWEVRLEPMEWKAYLGRLQGEAPALFYMGYSAPFDDPMSHLKLFLSTEPDNRSRYQSSAYDELVAKVRSSRGNARVKAAAEAQRLLAEKETIVIPLLERLQVHGVAKGIQGFRVNPYGVVDLREIRRKP